MLCLRIRHRSRYDVGFSGLAIFSCYTSAAGFISQCSLVSTDIRLTHPTDRSRHDTILVYLKPPERSKA